MEHLFHISSSSLPESTTRLLSFQGTEALSRPYEFEIFFAIQNDDFSPIEPFDMADAVGAQATLTADLKDGRAPFEFHGIFSSVRLIHEVAGSQLYRAVLVPRLWHLGENRHSRIFTGKTLPDIIKDVLEAGGLTPDEYRLVLDRTYPKEFHVCQYKESDLAFLHRWMEREGIYYFFEQVDGHETMVITDHVSTHEDLDSRPIPYSPVSGEDVSARACFDAFACERRARPASVNLLDYDYLRPRYDMGQAHEVSNVGFGEVHIHNERYFEAKHGEALAKVRSEELLAQAETFHASGTALYIRPGYTFTTERHPSDAYNATYLATAVHHTGNQAAASDYMRKFANITTNHVYRCDVTAIRSEVQFRPQQQTRWPRVYGTETAFVCGEATSEYAQLDEEGRYNIRFHFDESGLKNGKASTRVRMMQPHAGAPEGFHFPLRKDTEVVVAFLGGDPDRPVIAGAIPNKLTPSPVTKANHTQNVIHTGSDNRFEIEDEKGKQRITITTPVSTTRYQMGDGDWKTDFKADVSTSGQCRPHTIVEETEGSKYLYTGGDWDVRIATKHNEVVGDDVTQLYHGHKKETVDKTLEELYKDTKKETVVKALTEIYQNTKDETVTGKVTEKYNDKQDITIAKGLTETVTTGGITQTVGAGGITQTVTGDVNVNITGGYKLHYTNDWLEIGDSNKVSIQWGATTSTFFGVTNDNMIGGKISTFVGVQMSTSLALSADTYVGGKQSTSVAFTDDTFIGLRNTACLAIDVGLKMGLDITTDLVLKKEDMPLRVQGVITEIQNAVTVMNLAALTNIL